MTIFIVRTFRGYFLAATREDAEREANKLYDELEQDCDKNRVKKQDVWARIDIYLKEEYLEAPILYMASYWINKM